MLLKTWIVDDDTTRAIIVATDAYYAQRYAEQMGYNGTLHLIEVPTVFIAPLEPAICEKV